MTIRVAHSSIPAVAGAAADLQRQLGDTDHELLLYFASPIYPHGELAAALHGVLGAAHTVGCSTAGEIATGTVTTGSVVAMALSRTDAGRVAVALVNDLHDRGALGAAIADLERQLGGNIRELDATTHVGLVLMDGLSRGEEGFLEALGDRTDLLFVGGSAGDDLRFQETWVGADGRSSRRGAVLVVLEPPRGFQILKTQSFVELGKQLVATRVNEAERVVLEFNGQPAADAYAAAIGTSRAELPSQWIAHPLGLMAGGDPFVRSPQRLADDGVAFFCGMKAGMALSVLSSTDIVADTRALLARHRAASATGLINFNCILRTVDLQARGQTQAYADLFRDVPTIGFSTYGEAYVGHINQTATMLLLK